MEGDGYMSCVKTLNKTQHIFQEIIFLHFWEKESPERHLRFNMLKVKTRAFDLHHFYSHPNILFAQGPVMFTFYRTKPGSC